MYYYYDALSPRIESCACWTVSIESAERVLPISIPGITMVSAYYTHGTDTVIKVEETAKPTKILHTETKDLTPQSDAKPTRRI
jgi:hypothetical protein